MNHTPRDQTRRYDVGKRTMDIVASLVGLVLTVPLQAGIAVLVARALGRPVLFRQQRPGWDGRPFVPFKFRTMREPDERRDLITDIQRLTPLGALLRSTSLDELPTLWNVLRGDISLVGPRPLLMQHLDRYTPEPNQRHQVRPGITGLAQVSGRNALTLEQNFAADLDYVRRRDFALDLRILALTIEPCCTGTVSRRTVRRRCRNYSARRTRTMTAELVIDGVGGFGRETFDVMAAINAAKSSPPFTVLSVLDDGASIANLDRLAALGVRHLGGIDDWLGSSMARTQCALAVGAPGTRRPLADCIMAAGATAPPLVHPRTGVGSQCRLGMGAIVCAGVDLHERHNRSPCECESPRNGRARFGAR